MIRVSVYGRLGADHVERTTASGKTMVTGTLAVNVARPGTDPATEWFGLAAFGKVGEVLARHAKGELVAVMGALHRRSWTDCDGNERARWSLTVESILSARTVRPSGGKRRPADQPAPAQGAAGDGAPFDDPLPI